MTLAGTLQIGHHLAHGTAGVQFTQPGGRIGVGVVRGFLLLDVHQHDRDIQIPHSRQHVVGSGVGQQLQDHQVHICSAKLITRRHGQLFGGDDAAVDDLHGVRDGLFEGSVLLLKFGHEGRELGQVGTQRNGEHANTGFGFNEHG